MGGGAGGGTWAALERLLERKAEGEVEFAEEGPAWLLEGSHSRDLWAMESGLPSSSSIEG